MSEEADLLDCAHSVARFYHQDGDAVCQNFEDKKKYYYEKLKELQLKIMLVEQGDLIEILTDVTVADHISSDWLMGRGAYSHFY